MDDITAEQVARLAESLPAMKYGRDAWLKVRSQFPGAVGKDSGDYVVECIEKLRAENTKLRDGLELIAKGAESAVSIAKVTLREASI